MIKNYIDKDGVEYIAETGNCDGCAFDKDVDGCLSSQSCIELFTDPIITIKWVKKNG